MTQLQKDILLVILKSQLQIENAVWDRLNEMRKSYDTSFLSDNILITSTRIAEIRRQINLIENGV